MSTKSAIPEAVLKKHTAVFGMTGSGKTSTVKLLIEQVVHGGSRVCILDPIKSDHWGLTSSKSGAGPGLPFQILGGPHGHVPLHAGAGGAIGELVASGKLPLSIIDMRDFGPGGLQKFFNDFAPVLMRKMRGVLYLVIEEAHEFAPKEKSGIGGESMATYNAKKLATAGRSNGVRLVVASQRVQALHNAVIGSCETMIVHRMSDPADQEPVTKRLKATVKDRQRREEIEISIPELADGEGWICSGAAKLIERVQFPRIHTFDNSATPEDDSHRASVVTAKVDVQHLRELIGTVMDEAGANDPAELKKEIASLKARLAAKPVGATVEELHAAAADGYTDGCKAGADAGARAMRQHVHFHLDELAAALTADVGTFRASLSGDVQLPTGKDLGTYPVITGFKPTKTDLNELKRPNVAPAPSPRGSTLGKSTAPVQRPAPTSGAAGRIAGGAPRNLLIALAQNPDGLRPRKLAILAEVQEGGSTWRGAFAKFRRESLVVETDLIRITAEGLDALGSYEPLPTGPALRDQWRQKIGGDTRRSIFDAILRAWPKSISAEAVAAEAGVEAGGSTWRGHMAHLRGLELVHGSAELRASDDLFE